MDYQTKTNLILPFTGTWLVSNGGRTPEINSHIKVESEGPQNQLFAYDFRMKSSGKETKLEEFEVFGKEVLAVADGVIIQVIDGSIDLLPGERDRSVGVGNAIIIDHLNEEYSFFCHLKHQSIKFKVGDMVKQGDILAQCGNTGNTFQPHIHYHLQDKPFMHLAKGLPAQFREIIVNGDLKKNYEPIRGELVSNPL